MYVAEVDQSGFGSSAKLRTGGLPLPLTRGAQAAISRLSVNLSLRITCVQGRDARVAVSQLCIMHHERAWWTRSKNAMHAVKGKAESLSLCSLVYKSHNVDSSVPIIKRAQHGKSNQPSHKIDTLLISKMCHRRADVSQNRFESNGDNPPLPNPPLEPNPELANRAPPTPRCWLYLRYANARPPTSPTNPKNLRRVLNHEPPPTTDWLLRNLSRGASGLERIAL